MPQANITYDAPYNQRLVSLLREMDAVQEAKSYPARTPTPFGMRMGSYHGDLAGQMVGGGSSPMMYVPAGNSIAYPPLSLPAGMQVDSGGSYAGVDGAVGGKYSVKKFFRDVGHVGKAIIKNPIVKQVGKELLKEGLKEGTKALLSGAGKGGRSARAEIVKKVMKEKGLKMIEASKYVKAHGLY